MISQLLPHLQSFFILSTLDSIFDSARYGQSITDACISIEDTVTVLDTLAEGVRARRKHNSTSNGNHVV